MEQIRIDLVPGGVTPNAHASQYDVGRAIRFLLYNGGSAYTLAGTETITVDVTKPDGSTDTVSVTNTSSNYVDFVTTDGLLNQAGLYPCEISIVDGDTEIGSQNFNLRAEADAYDGADIVTVTVGPADICTFTTTLAEPLQSVTVDIEATGGNGTPDNPNPINGYTEANITNRTGLNLWDEQWELANGRVTSKNFIRVTPSTRYFFYNTNLYDVTMYDNAYNNLGHPSYGSRPNGFVFQTSANCVWIKFDLGSPYGSTYHNDVSINYPETDMEYHPYTGNTVTIAFGQTVYGGVLDVTRGKLHVTYGIVDLSNTSKFNFTYDNITKRWQSPLSDIKVFAQRSADVIAEQWQADITVAAGSESKFFTVGGALYFYTSDNVNKPVGNLVYPLKTPFDIDLTPEVISAVVGTNNVFADCGETEVKYLKAGA